MNNEHVGFSPEALVILNNQVFVPNAVAKYDPLAGGLRWPDEFPEWGSPEWKLVTDNDAHRYLIAYRASVTLGTKREKFRHIWEQVIQFAPLWPGLSPERYGSKALHRLMAAKRLEKKCVE